MNPIVKRRKMIRPVSVLFLGLFTLLLMGGNQSLSWGAEKPYPTKPINMVYSYGPGGPHDIASRALADRMEKVLGEKIITVYKPGGGGTLAPSFVAKSKPDGYTILVGSSSGFTISPVLKKLEYKLDDFELVGIFSESFTWLAVRADARWKNLIDFIEEARKSPGQLKISSFGKLSASDFVIQIFCKAANIKLTQVPFKSNPESLTAVLGGHVDAGMVTATGGLVDSGDIRMLALAGEKRWEDLPDVPAFKEFGDTVDYSAWVSLCVPKGTPVEVIDKLRLAQKKAFEVYQKELKEEFRKVEMRAVLLNPQESMVKYKKQYELTYKIAEELGVAAK